MKKTLIKKLALSAMFIAIGIVLPLFTGQIKQIGNMLLPMHLPVMLCGLICSWQYGAAVGFVLPIMRSLLFSMPVMYPNAIAMAFELAAYGFVIGFLFSRFKNKNLLKLYISLISAMVIGRLVWGLIEVILLGLGGSAFTFSMFVTSSVLNAIPGIILQLILIPLIMFLLEKMNVISWRNKL